MRPATPTLVTGLLTAVVLAVPGLAAAQVRVAVLPIEVEGELEGEALGSVVEAFSAGLGGAGAELVAPSVLAEASAAAGLEAGCVAGPCLRELARAASADALLRSRVGQVGQIYTARLELLDAEGRSLAVASGGCEVCAFAEAMDALSGAARELAGALPGVLVVTAEPPEARVTVDGAPVGAGDRLVLPAGEHVVAAELAGGPRAEQRLTLGPAARMAVALSVASPAPPPPALPEPEPPARRQPRAGLSPLAIAGVVTAVAAAAALVPGVLWLALEGRCAIGSPTQDGMCAEVYYTWPQGLALTALGGALAVTSATLFVVDATRARRARAALTPVLAPGPSGAVVGVVGRF